SLRQAAQDLLRLALVVLIGAVEEVDARVADDLVHGARRRFVGVAAKGHGAEAEFGDGDAGTAEKYIFHIEKVLPPITGSMVDFSSKCTTGEDHGFRKLATDVARCPLPGARLRRFSRVGSRLLRAGDARQQVRLA